MVAGGGSLIGRWNTELLAFFIGQLASHAASLNELHQISRIPPDLPEAHALVGAGGSDVRTVGRPRHTVQKIAMSPKQQDLRSGLCIPDAGASVIADCHQLAAIGRPGHSGHVIFMTIQSQQQFASGMRPRF